MGRLRYVSGATGKVIELDGPITFVGIAGEFRAGRWKYNLEGNIVTSPRREAYEGKLEATTSLEIADSLSPIGDADFSQRKPGLFEGDGWHQRGYLLPPKPISIRRPKCKLEIPVILLDGVWQKEETISMRQASGDANGTKIYPYTYPYYYASEFGVRYIEITDASPIPFKFTFYGSAINPSVRINGNMYQFNITVPEGGYLSVDSLPDPAVTLVTKDGTRTGEFWCAERGDGEGSGTYSFERMNPGTNEVWWSDMFGFDLTLIHERSDFPLCS